MNLNYPLEEFKMINSKTAFKMSGEEVITFYSQLGLFFDGICPNCNHLMSQWNDETKLSCSQKFNCKKCNCILSKRYNTIFQNMRIGFQSFNMILYYYALGFTAKEIFELLQPLVTRQIGLKTVSKYVKLLRLMINLEVHEQLSNMILPGPIEIDEACIYKLKRGNHGRLAKIIYWVFALKCRTTKKIIIYPVLYRTRDIIFPLIQRRALPGTVIYSDMFSVYWNNRRNPPQSHLETLGYIHYGVNHSIEFVSSLSSHIHTNTIERARRTLKQKLRNYKPKKFIAECISEFMIEAWVPKDERYYFYLYLIYKYNKMR